MKDEWIIERMVTRSEALGASKASFGEIQPLPTALITADQLRLGLMSARG